MRLLLTSNGLANESIAQALVSLVGKPAEETSIAFIPTAMNPEEGEKDWLINDLVNIQKQHFKQVDIVDISALPREAWQPRLETADVLFFSGGNTYHLMYWMRRSGLAQMLPELLKTRVYAGISAGSIAAAPTIILASDDTPPFVYDAPEYEGTDALQLVDFYFRPHLNAPNFPKSLETYLRECAPRVPGIIYALDDESALAVIDGKVEIVSEGKYLVLNQ